MKKLKINKKIVTVATYTIAILCAINFAIYPGTNAIFKKDNDRALAYETNLKDVYKDSIINPERKDLVDLVATNNEKTTPTNAVFGIPFKIDTENKGVYRISMSNTKGVCTVLGTTDATPINLTLKEIENSDPKDYYLTPINESVTTGTVYVSCPVAINDTNYKVKLYEHVETTVGETIEVEDEFLYASSELVLDYNAYQSQFSSLYKDFYESFQEYKINNVGVGKNIYNLIEENFKVYFANFEIDLNVLPTDGDGDPTRILNRVASAMENEEQVIPGVNYNSTTKKFEFDEYFIGYVQTYCDNATKNITMNPAGLNQINIYFAKENITPYTLKATIDLVFSKNDRDKYDSPKTITDYIEAVITPITIDSKEYYTLSSIRNVLGHDQNVILSNYQASFRPYMIDNAHNYNVGINMENEKIFLRVSGKTIDFSGSAFNNGLDLIKFKANQNNKDYSEIIQSIKDSYDSHQTFYRTIVYTPSLPITAPPAVYREIHKNGEDYKLVKVERSETESTTDVTKSISITNLSELDESNIIINDYIAKYLSDHNLTMTMENLGKVPGLTLATIMDSETPGQIKSQYITFDDNFMTYADMYLNGISQEEMLKLINKDSTSLAASLYDESVINSLIASYLITGSPLNSAINGLSQSVYSEIHYDKANKNLLLIMVEPNNNNSKTEIYTLANYSEKSNEIIENMDTIEFLKNYIKENGEQIIFTFLPGASFDSNIKGLLEQCLVYYFNIYIDEDCKDHPTTDETYYRTLTELSGLDETI